MSECVNHPLPTPVSELSELTGVGRGCLLLLGRLNKQLRKSAESRGSSREWGYLINCFEFSRRRRPLYCMHYIYTS